ncbi:MAG: hypothetical protein ACR2IK_03075 [Chloroflexota bacterium]
MLVWLKRFGLHLAAAIGATGIFVAAAAVGAHQTRQQTAAVGPLVNQFATPGPGARRKPSVLPVPTAPQGQSVIPTPRASTPGELGGTAVQGDSPDPAQSTLEAAQAHGTPAVASPRPVQPRRTPTGTAPASAGATPTADKVAPERSLTGTIADVLPDGLVVIGAGNREWRVTPAPGALIRLNGKAAHLDALSVGDTLVILGQAQPKEGPLYRFFAHAITARRT